MYHCAVSNHIARTCVSLLHSSCQNLSTLTQKPLAHLPWLKDLWITDHAVFQLEPCALCAVSACYWPCTYWPHVIDLIKPLVVHIQACACRYIVQNQEMLRDSLQTCGCLDIRHSSDKITFLVWSHILWPCPLAEPS